MFTKAWNVLDDFGRTNYGTLAAFAISIAVTAGIFAVAL